MAHDPTSDPKPEQLTERVITPMSKSLVEAVDDYRFKMRVASRAEAIRQLIAAGLASAQKGKAGEP